MPWIAVDSKLPSHRKLRILRNQLGISLHEAIGILVTIWLWALEDADRQGLIVIANARDMAEIIRWNDNADLLTKALTEATLIHIDEKGILIHDWQDHQGPLEAYRNKQKSQREYMKKKRVIESLSNRSDNSRDNGRGKNRIDCSINTEPIHNNTKPYIRHSYIGAVPQKVHEAIFAWLGGVPPIVIDDLTYFMNEVGCDEDLILEAVAETRGRGVKSWDYARAVIKSATDDGVLKGSDFKERQKARKAAKVDADGKHKGQGPYVEGGYDWNKLAGG